MLGAIRAVTTLVSDLEAIDSAYTRYLGYRAVENGMVPAISASVWGAPKMAGRPYLIMESDSGEATYLRFIQSDAAKGYKAQVTYGWNSTELTVQNTDELAKNLADSPFRIIGPPKNLDGYPTIRAMQVIGPCGEVLYLTDVSRESEIRLARANSFVGRVFITVAGGPDIEAMRGFYNKNFGIECSPTHEVAIGVLSDANGLPADANHGLAMAPLTDGTLLELDRYPSVAGPRSVTEGELPPGMALVTLEVAKLPDMKFVGDTGPAAIVPHKGARSAVIRGAAGELIELIEHA